jgi:hypothetical protein
VLHQTADYLVRQTGLKVISFDELLNGGIVLN